MKNNIYIRGDFMKKILSVMALTLVIILSDVIGLNLFWRYGDKLKVAEALEKQEKEEPCIYYDTLFNELNPEQLLAYNNGIFIATDDKVYEYNIEKSAWVNLEVGKPTEVTMGTLKGLNYSSIRNGFAIKEYKKVIADINNDGKNVYELNKTSEGKYRWDKIIENGRFCKVAEDNADEYEIISFYNEVTNESKIKTDRAEFYILGNNLYAIEKDKEPELIKTYEEATEKLNIVKLGKEVFVYGENLGVERIVSSKHFNSESYLVYAIGDFKFSSKMVITDIASPDDGHTLFVINSENKVYKIMLSNTWIPNNTEISAMTEMYCSSNEVEKVKEVSVDSKVFKIVKNDEWGKAYITVNDKILEETIRDSYQYPDQITRFSSVDDYIYCWSNVSQPIRVNIRDESVEFMGQRDIFNNINNLNEKIIKDVDGNIYLVKGDKRVYRLLEKNKFYDSGLPYKVSDIKVMNDQCYAISGNGLYLFNSSGQWETIIEGDINNNYDEQLIVLGNSLYALSKGSLYKLSESKEWNLVESKVNKGLTSIYYVDDEENKVYFLSEEKGKYYVKILEYAQNQWSKTKVLPEINGIKSVAVEGVNIYVSTQYLADGAAYVYRNCTWTSVLPQLDIEECGALKNSALIKQEDKVYFQTSEKEKEAYGIWQLKDGNVSRVENAKEQEMIAVKLNQENVVYTNQMGITYALKNGKVMRKVM